jgi:hypothetical protein
MPIAPLLLKRARDIGIGRDGDVFVVIESEAEEAGEGDKACSGDRVGESDVDIYCRPSREKCLFIYPKGSSVKLIAKKNDNFFFFKINQIRTEKKKKKKKKKATKPKSTKHFIRDYITKHF